MLQSNVIFWLGLLAMGVLLAWGVLPKLKARLYDIGFGSSWLAAARRDFRLRVPLIGTLSEDLRVQLLNAIGGNTDSLLINVKVGALKDWAPSVRRTAAEVLGRGPHPVFAKYVIPALRKAARDRDRSVRLAAIWSLGCQQEPEALQYLLAFLDHRDPDIRRTAARSLYNGGVILPVGGVDLRGASARQNSLHAFATTRCTARLAKRLSDADVRVRLYSAAALLEVWRLFSLGGEFCENAYSVLRAANADSTLAKSERETIDYLLRRRA